MVDSQIINMDFNRKCFGIGGPTAARRGGYDELADLGVLPSRTKGSTPRLEALDTRHAVTGTPQSPGDPTQVLFADEGLAVVREGLDPFFIGGILTARYGER